MRDKRKLKIVEANRIAAEAAMSDREKHRLIRKKIVAGYTSPRRECIRGVIVQLSRESEIARDTAAKERCNRSLNRSPLTKLTRALLTSL